MSFSKMCVLVSSVPTAHPDWSHQITKGSDMARGDDTASLKLVVVEWIHDSFGINVQRLVPKHKVGRGLGHDHCGKLLCPIEFDWSDLRCVVVT
jgi:hypothetical protein